jgi:c(7)-type cytochrome triheme protein
MVVNKGESFLKKIMTALVLSTLLSLMSGPADLMAAGKYWDFPTLPQPYMYGNILINRVSEQYGEQPVFFSHWSHRVKYTCRVCHYELDFEFELNKTEITEEDNRNGIFCGACHNGKEAFGHTAEHCGKCHTGTVAIGRAKFQELALKVPKGFFGNKLDWVKAIKWEIITPLYSIFHREEKPLGFKKRLELKAEWNYVPPAVFPHESHTQWLDCANCHPDIFNIRKKTTKNFAMQYILDRKFCGVCHLKVAFPLDDCTGCHPAMKREKRR